MSGGTILAIDPGTSKGCALAFFEYEILTDYRIASVRDPRFSSFLADDIVVEIPEISYGVASSDDLIRVAVAGARMAERYSTSGDGARTITELRPREWKGSAPKPIHHRRLWEVLTPSEVARLGGAQTYEAITQACKRGAKDKWRKPGDKYYRRREMVAIGGVKVDDNILDAAALGCTHLGRLPKP